jgi:hypothetical protein
MEEMRNMYKMLTRKPEGSIPLAKILMQLLQECCNDVNEFI